MEKALTTIEKLKAYYNADRFHFDMNLSMFLSGPSNKRLRQEIMFILTGEKVPASKCGIHAISDKLKASMEQFSLF